MLSVWLQGAARLQNSHPLDGIDISADLLSCRQKDVIFEIQDSRSAVGAFQIFPELDEFPTLVVRHGGVGNTLKELGSLENPFEKFVGAALKHSPRLSGTKKQKHPIDLFPHLDRHLFPHSPRIFPRQSQAGIHRIGISSVESDEFDNRVLCDLRVVLLKKLVIFEREDD